MNINQYLASKNFNQIRLFFRESRKSGLSFVDKGALSILIKTESGEQISNSIIDATGEINFSFKGIDQEINVDEFKHLAQKNEDCFFPNSKYSITDTGIIFYDNANITGFLNLNIRSKLCRDEQSQNIDLSILFIQLVAKYLKGIHVPIGNGYPDIYRKWEDYKYPNEFYFNPVFKNYETTLLNGIFSINSKQIKLEIDPTNHIIAKNQIDRVESIINNTYLTRPILLKFFWTQYHKWKEDYELPEIKSDEHLFDIVSLFSITIPENSNELIRFFFRTWDEEHGQFAYYKTAEEITFE